MQVLKDVRFCIALILCNMAGWYLSGWLFNHTFSLKEVNNA